MNEQGQERTIPASNHAQSETAGFRRPASRSPHWRQFGLLLAAIVLLGLPIRLLIAQRAAMVSRDTVTFIWYAQALADNPREAMRNHAQHPLYPAMVLGAHKLFTHLPLVPAAVRDDPVRSWTVPAVAVTMLGGLAAIIAVYLLATALFDRTIGLVAAVLTAAAAELCQLSADGLTDMPHLAVYLTALWAGLRGFQTGRYGWFACVGVLAGTAYLLRPEGAEPAVVVAVLLVVPWIGGFSWRKRLLALACVLIMSAAVASPYMLATGKLVQKKSIWRFLESDQTSTASGLGEPDRSGRLQANAGPDLLRAGAADVPRSLVPIAENWARSLRGTYLLPLLAWLILRRHKPADAVGSRMVQAAVALHLLILILLIVRFDYWSLFSLRHVVVLTGLTLPFAAAGVVVFVETLPDRVAGWAAMLLGLGLIAPTLPWMFEVRHGDDAHFRSAARWMHANTPFRPRIMTERYRMAFYAQGDYIPAPLTADAPEYLARARRDRPDWIAFDERRILKESARFFADLESGLVDGESLQLARIETRRSGRGARRVLIYHYQPPN